MQPKLSGASIVVLGSFNPSIVQPFWLAHEKVYTPKEAEAADVQAIADEIAVFTIDVFRFQVTRERFEVSTTDASCFRPLRDRCSAIFKLLEHSQAWRMGFNTNAHFQLQNSRELHAFEDALVPKAPWHNILGGLDRGSDGPPLPGLTTLTLAGQRDGSDSDRHHVTIEPSTRFPAGVFISINEEFKLGEPPNQRDLANDATSLTNWSELIQQYLERDWDSFLSESQRITRALLKDRKVV